MARGRVACRGKQAGCVRSQLPPGCTSTAWCRPTPSPLVPSEPPRAQSFSGRDATQGTGKLSALTNTFYCKTSSFKTSPRCFCSRARRVWCVRDTAVRQRAPRLNYCPSAVSLLGSDYFVSRSSVETWVLLADAQPLHSNYCLMFILQWLLRSC